LTCLANAVAKHIEANLDHRTYEIQILPEVKECLGLTSKSITDYCASAIARYEKVSCRYNAV
jgi:hypothetical protein